MFLVGQQSPFLTSQDGPSPWERLAQIQVAPGLHRFTLPQPPASWPPPRLPKTVPLSLTDICGQRAAWSPEGELSVCYAGLGL